jgi:hypothetical protein
MTTAQVLQLSAVQFEFVQGDQWKNFHGVMTLEVSAGLGTFASGRAKLEQDHHFPSAAIRYQACHDLGLLRGIHEWQLLCRRFVKEIYMAYEMLKHTA